MKLDNILKELKTECFFKEVFDETTDRTNNQLYIDYPRKIVHARANYDRKQWDVSFWGSHSEFATPDVRYEIHKTYAALISEHGFKNLDVLCDFCKEHPQALVNEKTTDEYNFYFEGEYCYYWLRCITRSNEYNIYLHAFLKSEDIFTEYFKCLDLLKASGKLNKQGEVSFLRKKYPMMEYDCVRFIVKKWLEANGRKENNAD